MSFKNGRSLVDLAPRERATIERIELSEDFSERLMQLGFVPGAVVEAIHAAPGGDPRVYHVDGADIALRRDTALFLKIR